MEEFKKESMETKFWNEICDVKFGIEWIEDAIKSITERPTEITEDQLDDLETGLEYGSRHAIALLECIRKGRNINC